MYRLKCMKKRYIQGERKRTNIHVYKTKNKKHGRFLRPMFHWLWERPKCCYTHIYMCQKKEGEWQQQQRELDEWKRYGGKGRRTFSLPISRRTGEIAHKHEDEFSESEWHIIFMKEEKDSTAWRVRFEWFVPISRSIFQHRKLPHQPTNAPRQQTISK